jgi:hypothetical protein
MLMFPMGLYLVTSSPRMAQQATENSIFFLAPTALMKGQLWKQDSSLE